MLSRITSAGVSRVQLIHKDCITQVVVAVVGWIKLYPKNQASTSSALALLIVQFSRVFQLLKGKLYSMSSAGESSALYLSIYPFEQFLI
jgi:hypothetical protein